MSMANRSRRGQNGHLASECSKEACNCFAKKSRAFRCYNCGNLGHYASECYFLESRLLTRRDLVVPKRRGVYVLQYKDGSFYVGKSRDIASRVARHAKCSTCKGTPVEIEPVTEPIYHDWESWERNETLELMRLHGIQKVRGWKYTMQCMHQSDIDDALSQIREKYDLCRKCGQANHFAMHCPLNQSFD